MLLMLLRHGAAEDEGPDGTDASRRLTDGGVRTCRRVAQALSRVAEAPELILTSPLVRASQTAELAREALGSPLEVCDALGDQDMGKILTMLGQRRERSVMLVGHEPSFSSVVERLCAPDASGGFIKMKKAGCACLDVDFETGAAPRAALLWLAPPPLTADSA